MTLFSIGRCFAHVTYDRVFSSFQNNITAIFSSFFLSTSNNTYLDLATTCFQVVFIFNSLNSVDYPALTRS